VNTWLGAWSAQHEAEETATSYADYKKEQASLNIRIIGQPAIYAVAGIPQTPGYPSVFAQPGQLLSVDFGFLDPATGLPTTGPSVASVAYEVDTDPLSATNFVPIGTSFDAGSNFSISYLISTTFEPGIQAIPYDANGDPIVITGLGGDNVAQGKVVALFIPEPSTFALLLPSLLMLVGAMRLKSRRGSDHVD
jgi:hypothetical protein